MQKEKPELKSWKDFFKVFGAGLSIGAADIVPGISGGTVAFIIGIYEDLLKSIATLNGRAFSLLFRLKFKAFFEEVSWKFLLAVILGVVFSFISLAKLFTFFLNHETYRCYLYALFLGLVSGSVFYCSKQISSWKFRHFVYLLIAAFFAFKLTGTDLIPKNDEPLYKIEIAKLKLSDQDKARIFSKKCVNYDSEKKLLSVPKSCLSGMISKGFLDKESFQELISTEKSQSFLDFWVIACGAIAISAMLLPGISGSYLLTILGMYGFILGNLVDFLEGLKAGHFDFTSFRIVFSMVLGIALGAILFSRVVSYLLNRYPNETLSALVGFMIGALRAVWPFYSYDYEIMPLRLLDGSVICPKEPILPNFFSAEFACAFAFGALGLSLVLIVENFAKKRHAQHIVA